MPPSSNSRPIVFTEIEQFGGAERAALALCRWLSQRGVESHIVAYEDRCGLADFSAVPIKVVQLRPDGGVSTKVRALRKYFADRGPSAPKPLMSGYQPALHSTLAGLRGFHTLMHDTPVLFDDPASAGGARRLVSNKLVDFGLRSGGKTIVTSEFLRDECWRDFRVRAEIVRMGGFPRTAGAARPFEPSGALRMLSVCRLEPNKRLDWMLHALAALERAAVAPLAAPLSQVVDWRFDVAGKGPQLEALQTLATQAGVGQRIRFHGFVRDAELETLYQEANLFLMPAVQGYGIPAVEALGRGIPVLLHRDSGVSDILRDTAWATVFEGGAEAAVTALAEAIDSVTRERHLSHPLPELPTEDVWAERVARVCGWVPPPQTDILTLV